MTEQQSSNCDVFVGDFVAFKFVWVAVNHILRQAKPYAIYGFGFNKGWYHIMVCFLPMRFGALKLINVLSISTSSELCTILIHINPC